VIGSMPYKQETVSKLLEQPFPFLAMNPRTLADIEADIRLLGGITQKAAATKRLVKNMRRRSRKSRRSRGNASNGCASIAKRGRIRESVRRPG